MKRKGAICPHPPPWMPASTAVCATLEVSRCDAFDIISHAQYRQTSSHFAARGVMQSCGECVLSAPCSIEYRHLSFIHSSVKNINLRLPMTVFPRTAPCSYKTTAMRCVVSELSLCRFDKVLIISSMQRSPLNITDVVCCITACVKPNGMPVIACSACSQSVCLRSV